MRHIVQLESYLQAVAHNKPALSPVCETVRALAVACLDIAALASLGALDGGAERMGVNADGDDQKSLDLKSQDLVMRALERAPVAAAASEEMADWSLIDESKPLAVAFDPLDGSNNIDVNGTMGTIFSILPAKGAANPFLGTQGAPLAAGFFVYGPQTALALTLGDGVDLFTFDRRSAIWALTSPKLRIASGSSDFAINAANSRYWEEPVQVYIADCLSGDEGPRAKNFNMRWLGCVVAESYRILLRGGVYLYPSDRRPAYREGRLRLLYEGHPIAFVMEQAGGAASTGYARVLDSPVTSLHQRTPLIMGSLEKVAHIDRLHQAPNGRTDHSPLFGQRGLFRA